MADPKLVKVFCEGSDDHEVLQGLKAEQLLPAHWEITPRDASKFHGWTGMIQQLALVLAPGVPDRAVALMDLDDRSIAKCGQVFLGELTNKLPKEPALTVSDQSGASARALLYTLTGGGHERRVALVTVGLPADEQLRKEYELTGFAMDDPVLRLAKDQAIYEAARSSESQWEHIDHEHAMQKIQSIAKLLRDNGLTVARSKRFLDFLRTIVGFRVSPAAFVKRLISSTRKCGGQDRLRQTFQPLLDDMAEAARFVDAAPPSPPPQLP